MIITGRQPWMPVGFSYDDLPFLLLWRAFIVKRIDMQLLPKLPSPCNISRNLIICRYNKTTACPVLFSVCIQKYTGIVVQYFRREKERKDNRESCGCDKCLVGQKREAELAKKNAAAMWQEIKRGLPNCVVCANYSRTMSPN